MPRTAKHKAPKLTEINLPQFMCIVDSHNVMNDQIKNLEKKMLFF